MWPTYLCTTCYGEPERAYAAQVQRRVEAEKRVQHEKEQREAKEQGGEWWEMGGGESEETQQVQTGGVHSERRRERQ